MNHRQQIIVDLLMVFAVTVLAVVTGYVLVVVDAPRWLLTLALTGLTMVAMGSVVARFVRRPDHLRARQSHQILDIANESLAFLRTGLDEETAGAVCRIILDEAEVAAVAITDTEQILGFAGVGESHHNVGRPDPDAGDARGHRDSTSTASSTPRRRSAARRRAACCGRRSSCRW